MFLKVRYLRTVYAGYLLLALYGCDRNHTYDIVSRASSGKIINGSGNTLGNGSVRFRFAQSLNQFVTDISRIQIREDQHVGLSCYGASGSFGSAYAGNDSGIQLQFAVQFQIRIGFFCNLYSLGHFVDISMFCTAHGGVGKECDLRLFSNQQFEG